MLCIKKNKCFVLRKINFNPFRPVETCRNTFQSVQICWNTFPGLPPSPPSPFSIPPPPPFFFLGGGRGREGGKPPPPKPPGRGGGRSPPPPPDFNNNNKKQNSRTLSSSNLQNLCNLPLPPKGFSQSTAAAAAAQNYINTYGGGLSTKFIVGHTSIFIFIYIYYISPLNI